MLRTDVTLPAVCAWSNAGRFSLRKGFNQPAEGTKPYGPYGSCFYQGIKGLNKRDQIAVLGLSSYRCDTCVTPASGSPGSVQFSEESDTSNPWKEVTWRDTKDGNASGSADHKASSPDNKSKAKEAKSARGAATMVGHYESWREAALALRNKKA
eukprot:442092-Pyramimonas_sp.AAC.1